MIAEVAKREEECQELLLQVKERTKNLKIVFSMIRSPKMCDLFYKEDRKRYTKDMLRQMDDNAVFTLR